METKQDIELPETLEETKQKIFELQSLILSLDSRIAKAEIKNFDNEVWFINIRTLRKYTKLDIEILQWHFLKLQDLATEERIKAHELRVKGEQERIAKREAHIKFQQENDERKRKQAEKNAKLNAERAIEESKTKALLNKEIGTLKHLRSQDRNRVLVDLLSKFLTEEQLEHVYRECDLVLDDIQQKINVSENKIINF